ncbi:hypothetical protein C8Q76DRAFT_161271 [Earliella scabrosa]|nr:hypothetical protein C8Q76DRAFT_161271 [Earliella scabrosa]
MSGCHSGSAADEYDLATRAFHTRISFSRGLTKASTSTSSGRPARPTAAASISNSNSRLTLLPSTLLHPPVCRRRVSLHRLTYRLATSA